ncbi:MAG: DUF2339 domain-containing protein [Gemmatimonadetes bacterium]|nr:DUF2339 domain-containing protein [Gemmatimonadota bacterium]
MREDGPDQDLRTRVERLEREIKVLREALGRRSDGTAETPSPAGMDAQSEQREREQARRRLESLRAGQSGEAEQLGGGGPAQDTSPPQSAGFESAPERQSDQPSGRFSAREILESAELWLPRVGIGLVLLAVALAFKYSIDQGWVIPAVRVALGYGLGLILLVLGFRLSESRPQYVQALFGGAVATFYITGFAAFRLYGLFSYPIAFGLMIAATVLAFFLSLAHNRAALSVIGVAGGLGTPFLLFTGSGSVPGLIAYTTLVLAGASAVYFDRGWRSLLWVSFVGGWAVMLIALTAASGSQAAFLDKASLQAGIVFAWIWFWALPLMREVVSTADPGRWSPPKLSPELLERIGDFTGLGDTTEEWLRRHVHLLSILTPLLTLALTSWAWRLSTMDAGFVALGLTGVYALAARMLMVRPGMKGLGHTQGLVALMLSTVALALMLDGEVLLLTLAAQALVVHVVAKRISDPWAERWGHLLFGIVAFWLTARLTGGIGPARMPILNVGAMTDLALLAAALGASSFVARGATMYRVVPQVGLALLLGRELGGSSFAGGHALLLAWAAQAWGTHVLAKRWSDPWTSRWGHVLWVIVAFDLAGRLVGMAGAPPMLNVGAIADLGAIAGAVLACRMLGREKVYYYLTGHAAVLALMWREFVPLSGGHAYVSFLWAAYGIALLVIGLRSARQAMWQTGAATLLLLVGKLFVVDLANLEAIWRILLFMVVGGGFLALGYAFPNLRKLEVDEDSRR